MPVLRLVVLLTEGEAEFGQLLLDLGERGLAEVFGGQEFCLGLLDEVAQGDQVEPLEAFAGAAGELDFREELVKQVGLAGSPAGRRTEALPTLPAPFRPAGGRCLVCRRRLLNRSCCEPQPPLPPPRLTGGGMGMESGRAAAIRGSGGGLGPPGSFSPPSPAAAADKGRFPFPHLMAELVGAVLPRQPQSRGGLTGEGLHREAAARRQIGGSGEGLALP